MANVVLTPHIGGATWDTEAQKAMVADDIERLLAGHDPISSTRRSCDEIRRHAAAAVLAAAKDMLRRGLVEGTAGNISARRRTALS